MLQRQIHMLETQSPWQLQSQIQSKCSKFTITQIRLESGEPLCLMMKCPCPCIKAWLKQSIKGLIQAAYGIDVANGIGHWQVQVYAASIPRVHMCKQQLCFMFEPSLSLKWISSMGFCVWNRYYLRRFLRI